MRTKTKANTRTIAGAIEVTPSGETLGGIEQLRRTLALLSNCSEDFNQRFTVSELLKLGRAYRACEWDVTPDRWHPEQIRDAISYGLAPIWDEAGHPVLPLLSRRHPSRSEAK